MASFELTRASPFRSSRATWTWPPLAARCSGTLSDRPLASRSAPLASRHRSDLSTPLTSSTVQGGANAGISAARKQQLDQFPVPYVYSVGERWLASLLAHVRVPSSSQKYPDHVLVSERYRLSQERAVSVPAYELWRLLQQRLYGSGSPRSHCTPHIGRPVNRYVRSEKQDLYQGCGQP